MVYRLRLFFDPESGVCLWAQNQAADATSGDAVDHWRLPLPENTRRGLDHLIAWLEPSLDWEDPGAGRSLWTEVQDAGFQAAVARLLKHLVDELPTADDLVESAFHDPHVPDGSSTERHSPDEATVAADGAH